MQGVWGFTGCSGCVSYRAGSTKLGTASGLSTGIATATESDLAAPNFDPTCIGAVVSAVISTSGRETTSGWVSGSGFFGGTSALLYVRPKYHGAGGFCATYVGRTCRHGRRLWLSGADTETNSLAGCWRPTLRLPSGFVSTSAP